MRGKNVGVRKRGKGVESVKKRKVNEEATTSTSKKVKKCKEEDVMVISESEIEKVDKEKEKEIDQKIGCETEKSALKR